LLQRFADVHLTNGKDEFPWNLHKNEKFSVASMYNAMIVSNLLVFDNKKIWKMKIPLKNNFFAWYIRRGVILNKDNLIKRNWHCRGFVNRSAIWVGVWRFVEGGEHGGAIRDGGSTSLPSFRSRTVARPYVLL
jgi:hypothetical protein